MEDARDVRLVISRLVEHTGLTVEGCESGEEALERADRRSFELALIDIGLPGIDGFETLKALRAAGHGFPCLALSGDSGPESRAAWLKLGGQGFLGKPVARRRLVDDLTRWLAPMGAAASTRGNLNQRFVTAMMESNRSLREAIATRDYGSIVEIAHRMKGTCGTFRATDAANAAALVLRCVETRDKDPDSLDRAYDELAEAVARLSIP